MRPIKRQFFIINKFIIKIIGEGIIKNFILINNIVRIEKVIYILKYDFKLAFLN